MQKYGFILLALGAIQVTHGNLFYFPVEKDIHWHPINYTSIRCPIRAGDQYPGYSANVQFRVPYSDSSNIINGHSCHKTQWVSECTETWYWTTDVKQYIRVLPVSLNECLEEKEKRGQGKSIAPFFEAPVCQWANTVRKENSFVILNEKRVQLDPYNGNVVDPLFPNGRCSTPVKGCPTIQDNVLWFTTEDPIKGVHMRTINLKYAPPRGDMKELSIWGEGVPVTKMSKSCKMSYANEEGVRFESGLWGIPIPGSDGKFTQWKDNLENCPEGTLLKLPNAHEEISEHQIEIEDLVLSLTCFEMINNFRDTGKISFTDLALLTPDHPGLGNVYRINKGVLEASSAFYQQCKIKPNKNDVICYGGNDFNTENKWKRWVDSGTPGTLSGYNGVYKMGGKIINAHENLMTNRIIDEDILKRDLKTVRHPIEVSVRKNSSHPIYFFDWTGERGNPVEDVFEGLNNFWRKAIEWIAIVSFTFLLCIAIFILFKLLGMFRSNKKDRLAGSGEHEMSLFR
ncbi:glycoprotein [Chaco virus]|uniref:Glycoprotein n=1 Tax=Chaco virus TaxID=1158189 RepID=A0A0D3R1R4_9RHAB|nr:glycoprotein [Chaco virus]AJR28410.1 glycoprotein [Chaco virus]